MFDHWAINDKLKELGWKKHEIPYFKKGLADSIQGHWNDKIINYSYDFQNWYVDGYSEPKMKPGPVTYKEKAYVSGYESGEDFIKQWLEATNTI